MSKKALPAPSVVHYDLAFPRTELLARLFSPDPQRSPGNADHLSDIRTDEMAERLDAGTENHGRLSQRTKLAEALPGK
jgi:hypothetical protein